MHIEEGVCEGEEGSGFVSVVGFCFCFEEEEEGEGRGGEKMRRRETLWSFVSRDSSLTVCAGT